MEKNLSPSLFDALGTGVFIRNNTWKRLKFDLDNLFAFRRSHLFINHQYDNSLVVETAASSSATHLNVLTRRHLQPHDTACICISNSFTRAHLLRSPNSRWRPPGGISELGPNQKIILQGSHTSVPSFIISPKKWNTFRLSCWTTSENPRHHKHNTAETQIKRLIQWKSQPSYTQHSRNTNQMTYPVEIPAIIHITQQKHKSNDLPSGNPCHRTCEYWWTGPCVQAC